VDQHHYCVLHPDHQHQCNLRDNQNTNTFAEAPHYLHHCKKSQKHLFYPAREQKFVLQNFLHTGWIGCWWKRWHPIEGKHLIHSWQAVAPSSIHITIPKLWKKVERGLQQWIPKRIIERWDTIYLSSWPSPISHPYFFRREGVLHCG